MPGVPCPGITTSGWSAFIILIAFNVSGMLTNSRRLLNRFTDTDAAVNSTRSLGSQIALSDSL